MAWSALDLRRRTFFCSDCLELLEDPVTLPCGHRYCFSCIKDRLDGEDEKGIRTKKTGPRAKHCYAGAEDVACDVCTGRKLKAFKSCLVCLASYCDTHLQPHRDAAPLKKHQLVEPSKNLQENVCSQHNEVMNMFCRSDQQCVCYLCSVDEHKGHDIVPAAAERVEKQEKLQESQQTIQQRIQRNKKDWKELQQEVKDIDLSADEAVEHSEKIYSQLIRLMEKRSSEVKQQIRSQQEAKVRQVQELQEKLDQEMAELRSKAAELQQLSHTEDHCRFLHDYSSASHRAGSTHSSSVHIRPRRCFEDVTAAVSESSQIIQELLRDTWTNIRALTNMEVSLPAEPRTREEFLRYFCDVTLDPNTAHTQLVLSEGNRRATCVDHLQTHPDHPGRFTARCQVLSRESLTGRRYWEVKTGDGAGEVGVAVAYENISRTGKGRDDGGFGNTDKSWALYYYDQSYSFWHNNISSVVSAPRASTLGVYLDHPAGLLSFYSVSDTMTLLHRVQTAFTRPLLVGLWVNSCDASAELVKLG